MELLDENDLSQYISHNLKKKDVLLLGALRMLTNVGTCMCRVKGGGENAGL